MNELEKMVRAIDATDETLFLATVVDVAGSSYRRPGAKMLILPGGRYIGSISGGCLERDLCKAAATVTEHGPKVISFDTRTEITDVNPRYDLGCSGVIYVLVERINRAAACPSRYLRQVLEREVSLVVATTYQGDAGRRLTADQLPASDALNAIVESVAGSGRPVCCELLRGEQSERLLIERLDPPKPLWIFGTGKDSDPLAAMARELGWKVRQFKSGAVPDAVVTPQTAVVLMTHSFTADAALLPWLLESCAGYIGILGPKSRTGKLMQELHARKNLPTPESLDRLHTPVGLDIGAKTAAEIAVAVVAEIIAIENGRSGGALKDRRNPIHDPVDHQLIELEPIPQAVR